MNTANINTATATGTSNTYVRKNYSINLKEGHLRHVYYRDEAKKDKMVECVENIIGTIQQIQGQDGFVEGKDDDGNYDPSNNSFDFSVTIKDFKDENLLHNIYFNIGKLAIQNFVNQFLFCSKGELIKLSLSKKTPNDKNYTLNLDSYNWKTNEFNRCLNAWFLRTGKMPGDKVSYPKVLSEYDKKLKKNINAIYDVSNFFMYHLMLWGFTNKIYYYYDSETQPKYQLITIEQINDIAINKFWKDDNHNFAEEIGLVKSNIEATYTKGLGYKDVEYLYPNYKAALNLNFVVKNFDEQETSQPQPQHMPMQTHYESAEQELPDLSDYDVKPTMPF